MISGRLHWQESNSKAAKLRPLASFVFSNGTLSLTEAGSRKRASLHLLQGEEALGVVDRGGIEVLQADLESFTAVLRSENHTLKRALTDPQLFSGIGNAYSDEILFAAQLSPTALTKKLAPTEIERLFTAARDQLVNWTERLRIQSGDKFPEKVTAFRPEMAVHGRFKQPCPRCGGKIQRIRYAANETNYYPTCQTGGKLLADRSLSRLLREDWPKSAEDLENKRTSELARKPGRMRPSLEAVNWRHFAADGASSLYRINFFSATLAHPGVRPPLVSVLRRARICQAVYRKFACSRRSKSSMHRREIPTYTSLQSYLPSCRR